MLLSNLKELKEDMVKKGWTICSFIFQYKKINYIVLVKRFVGTEKRVDNYALVKLHFMKENNLNDDMQVEANSRGLIIDAASLRQYFGIEYKNNLGNILQQFYDRLGKAIPPKFPDHFSNLEKKVMVRSLSRSDSEDPNKIYCYKIKRNPGGGKRSEFNTDKTKLLRESLYELLRDEDNVSFCYSADPKMEKDNKDILKNFSGYRK